jgi:hypothetical protein
MRQPEDLPIPWFDLSTHPFVPTLRWAQSGRAQARSRMPACQAPAQPARSVLDGAEHGATLTSQEGDRAPKIPLANRWDVRAPGLRPGPGMTP